LPVVPTAVPKLIVSAPFEPVTFNVSTCPLKLTVFVTLEAFAPSFTVVVESTVFKSSAFVIVVVNPPNTFDASTLFT